MKTHEVLRYPPVAMQAGWASHFPGDDYKLFLEIELDAIKRGVIIFLYTICTQDLRDTI